MAKKLTPETLRRLVLEEKAKIQKEKGLDPKAKKEMYMEMDEESWDKASSKMQTVKQEPGKKLKTLKMLKEHEQELMLRLRKLQERRLALRRQIINDLD